MNKKIEKRHIQEVKCDKCHKVIGYEVRCGDINCTEWRCPECYESELYFISSTQDSS